METTRRETLAALAALPLAPFMTLKGVKSPCRKRIKGIWVRVIMPNGKRKVYIFPDEREEFVCERP